MSTPLDALDYRIVNALQVNPRASWAELSAVLSSDATTLSRRWTRLTERGIVWSSCFYMPIERRRRQPLAFVEVLCEPARLRSVVTALSDLPEVFSVHATSGDRQLYVTVGESSVTTIDRCVRERIALVVGVTATRVHYIRRVFQEGGQWRLGALSDAQQATIAATRPDPAPDLAAEPTDEQWAVLAALGDDVRRPLSHIQARTGGSLPALSRRVNALLGADWAHWRIDVSHRALGYDCAVLLWLRAPQAKLEQIATSFRLLPESRLIASVTGPANLVISLWLRDLGDLDDLEQRVARVYPQVVFADVWVVPQVHKRAGHVLDEDGLHVRYVPFREGPSGEDAVAPGGRPARD